VRVLRRDDDRGIGTGRSEVVRAVGRGENFELQEREHAVRVEVSEGLCRFGEAR
jgi:hypothetical protein